MEAIVLRFTRPVHLVLGAAFASTADGGRPVLFQDLDEFAERPR